MEVLTYAASCTERLRLGCAVFVTSLHSPVHLAKSVSTLDQLSRDRLEVGIGTGGRGRMFSAFGVDPGSLVARLNEGLWVMKGFHRGRCNARCAPALGWTRHASDICHAVVSPARGPPDSGLAAAERRGARSTDHAAAGLLDGL
jgi:alkanesulfonate monooxygenase SsuD/methylene tetrahydromethanopterin reductase-like flavin-dependent oxidoreductase (luciferase family)